MRPEPEAAEPKPPVQRQESPEHGESTVTDHPAEGDLTEAVERAEGLREQIADLVQLVSNIQTAAAARPSPGASEPSAARLRDLASRLRNDLTGIRSLVDLLDSVADGLQPRQ